MNKATKITVKRYKGDPYWFILEGDDFLCCPHSQPTLAAAIDWAKTNKPDAVTEVDEKACRQGLGATTFKCTFIVLAILAAVSFILGIIYQGINNA